MEWRVVWWRVFVVLEKSIKAPARIIDVVAPAASPSKFHKIMGC